MSQLATTNAGGSRARLQARSQIRAQARRRPAIFTIALAVLLAMAAATLAVPTAANASGTSNEAFKAVGKGKASDGTYADCVVSSNGTKITLTSDVTLDDYWYITTTNSVTLDLNGHALKRGISTSSAKDYARWGCVIYMGKKSRLNVEDSAGGGTISGGRSKNCAGGIHCEANSRLYLRGGSLTGNESSWGAGGVYLDSSAYLYLFGGASISDNATSMYGGGVYADRDSRIYMYGGSISNNKAVAMDGVTSKGKGGGIYAHRAICYLSGGEVSGNTAAQGGGIHIEETSAKISGEYGFFISGSTKISGNKAQTSDLAGSGRGGGIYLDEKADMSLTGRVSISGNTAASGGGGVWADGTANSSLTVGGTPTVTDNKVVYSDGSQTTCNLEVKAESGATAFRVNGSGNLSEGASIGLTTQWRQNPSPVFASDDCAEGNNKLFATKYFPSDDWRREFLCVRTSYAGGVYSDGVVYVRQRDYGFGGHQLITGVELYDAQGNSVATSVSFLNNSITVNVPKDTDVTNLRVRFTTAEYVSGGAGHWESYSSSKTDGVNDKWYDFSTPQLFYGYNTATLSVGAGQTTYEVSVKVAEEYTYKVHVEGGIIAKEGDLDIHHQYKRDGEYVAGTQLTLKPDDGPQGKPFSQWKIKTADGKTYYSGDERLVFTTLDSNTEIESEYADHTDGDHSVDVYGGSGSGEYAQGETVSITANDLPGQTFTGWEIKSESGEVTLAASNDMSTSFTMPDEDVTVTATYAAAVSTSHTVSASVSPADATGCAVFGGGEYEAGDTVTLRALEDGAHDFTGWSGLPEGATEDEEANTVSFTMPDEDVAVEANFAEATKYAVSLNGNAQGSYKPGDTVTLFADAAYFKGWSGNDGLENWESRINEAGAAVVATFTMPERDVALTASCWDTVDSIEITMADLSDPQSAVSALSNGGEDEGEDGKYVTASVATWESTGAGGMTSITFDVSVNEGAWPNLRLAEDLIATVNGRRAAVTLAESGSSVATVTVEFLNDAAQCTLTFETNGGGAIEAVIADEGAAVDLSQYVPARDGYSFAGWYADAALTQRIETVSLDADVTVYAKWEKDASSGGGSGGSSGSSDNSGGGSDSVGTANGSNSGSTGTAGGKGSKKSMPQTGDATNYPPIIAAAAAGVAAVIAGIIVHRKRS